METVGGGRCVLPVLMLAISSSMTIAALDPCIVPTWCVMIDYVIEGFKDETIQTETQKLCNVACKDSGWCKSSSYEKASRQCQLNVASHYDESNGLVNKQGWVYSYTCLKLTSPAGQKSQDYPCEDGNIFDGNYPIFLTTEKFPSADLTQARERCAQCGMQLCSLAQLKDAYDAGYRNNIWGLFDTQGRDTKVTSCDIWHIIPLGECYYTVWRDAASCLIPNTPRPSRLAQGYCCQACHLDQRFPIFRTPELSPSLDLAVAKEHCALCGMTLCSLPQLKAAYDAGYRDYHWGLIDTLGRHAKVMSCDGVHNTTKNCYLFVEGDVKGYIPFASKSDSSEPAYCCPNCHVFENYPISFVPEKHPSADSTQARERCAQCDMQMCSLAQLKAAHDSGYRSDHQWGLIETRRREENVTSSGISYFNYCSTTVSEKTTSSMNTNTARPDSFAQGYCCHTCHLDQRFPIFRTPELSLKVNLMVATEHCALCGMKLCSLTQLKAAYDAGYRDDHWGLIDTLGRHAKVMPCDGIHNTTNNCFFFVEGGVEGSNIIPFSSNSESTEYAYCCLTHHVYENNPIFYVPEMYPSADWTQARERCAQSGMQLCSLAQLKAAYDAGYRNANWGSYDTRGRDVMVTSCSSFYFHRFGECHFTEEGEKKSSIPNTPRPDENQPVYCCKA